MLKYYIYTSDTKLRMLETQISKPLWARVLSNIKPEIGFDHFGIKAKVGAEGLDVGESAERIDKVVKALRAQNIVGTVGTPKGWFSGAMEMKWAAVGEHGGQLVVFVGIEASTIVQLNRLC